MGTAQSLNQYQHELTALYRTTLSVNSNEFGIEIGWYSTVQPRAITSIFISKFFTWQFIFNFLIFFYSMINEIEIPSLKALACCAIPT